MQPIDNTCTAAHAEQMLPAGGSKEETAGTSFAEQLSQAQGQDNDPSGAGSLGGRSWLWNMIARDNPALLQSNAVQGDFNSQREARVDDIRDNLTGIGVDLTTAMIIANREAGTTVTRPDNSRPGAGSSGYYSMPESIRSEAVSENSQVREGIGYAYIDRYGFSHVTRDLATALNYSGDGNVYEYNGRFGKGYPLDGNDSRAILDLPQVRMYSNAERVAREEAAETGGEVEQYLPGLPDGKVDTKPLTEEYIENFAQNARQAAGSILSIWQ